MNTCTSGGTGTPRRFYCAICGYRFKNAKNVSIKEMIERNVRGRFPTVKLTREEACYCKDGFDGYFIGFE